MKFIAALAAGLLVLPAAQAAGPVLVDFESPTSFASVLDHYNGGADSAGVAGANLGVAFGADALALANDALGPYFSNAPTALGVMAPVGGQATMNLAAGFSGAFSLWYSSSAAVASGVTVWSGLDGNGSLLASFDLASNAQAGGCSDSAYCHFDRLDGSLAGTARSMRFDNAANVAAFDDIRVTAVPEPAAWALMALGLAGVLAAGRRR